MLKCGLFELPQMPGRVQQDKRSRKQPAKAQQLGLLSGHMVWLVCGLSCKHHVCNSSAATFFLLSPVLLDST